VWKKPYEILVINNSNGGNMQNKALLGWVFNGFQRFSMQTSMVRSKKRNANI